MFFSLCNEVSQVTNYNAGMARSCLLRFSGCNATAECLSKRADRLRSLQTVLHTVGQAVGSF